MFILYNYTSIMSVERMCVILQPAAVCNVLNQLDCSEEREIYNDRFAASEQGFRIEPGEHIRQPKLLQC